MKNNKLISALTAVIISSVFAVSCNRDNNANNNEARAMDPAKIASIDINTGTRTGNKYSEDEEISGPVAPVKAPANPKGDKKLMENPSAVEHASQQANKPDKPATYENKPEGYVDKPAMVNANITAPVNQQAASTNTARVKNPTASKLKSKTPKGAPDSGYGINSQVNIDKLKSQIQDLTKKENELNRKIKNAAATSTYKPGIKNQSGPAGNAIKNEISSYKNKIKVLEKQIASLQKK